MHKKKVLADAVAVTLQLELLEQNLDQRLVGDLVSVLDPLAELEEDFRAGGRRKQLLQIKRHLQ